VELLGVSDIRGEGSIRVGKPDIILNHLADNPDVVLILPERGKGFVDIGP
jgi:hypothetical protein